MQYMRLALWPESRINEAFGQLAYDENITVVAADYVVIQGPAGKERRFYLVPPAEKKNCPTCGRRMP